MLYGIALALPLIVVFGTTLVLAVRFGIAAESFFHYIEKLANQGDRDRAFKLSIAAGDRPVARIIRKGLKMRLPGRFTDEDALADAAVETLRPDAEAESRRFMPFIAVAPLGIIAAVAVPFLPEVDLWVRLVVAVVLLAASANIVRLAFALRRDVYTAVGVVAPFVQGDVAERRDSEEE